MQQWTCDIITEGKALWAGTETSTCICMQCSSFHALCMYIWIKAGSLPGDPKCSMPSSRMTRAKFENSNLLPHAGAGKDTGVLGFDGVSITTKT
eukprot:scaffold322227_cov23-Tisochrysis_lutea.AAC.1